jgi:membrane-bound lytic murein transglycosylase B
LLDWEQLLYFCNIYGLRVGLGDHLWQSTSMIFVSVQPKSCLSALGLTLLAACSSTPEAPPVPAKTEVAVAPPVAAPVVPSSIPAPVMAVEGARATEPFLVWLAAFRSDALAKGIRAQTLDAAFADLRLSDRVIELDRSQPDVKASYVSYLRRHMTGAKIAAAQQAMADNRAALEAAAAAQGVPASVIVGIWGMETNFGGFSGNFPVIQALASLAYDGRRAAMFRRELMDALTMVDKGDASLAQMRGSWAGAFGQPQFMPSSYLRFAVDGDGSGNRDIWNSLPDVFGSIGNFLKQSGWVDGQGWGLSVAAPAGFDPASVANPVEPSQCKAPLRKHSLAKPISDWKALGFVPNGRTGWPADDALATLVFPEGSEGPAFLTLPNYRAIMAYNCSNYYALSVLLLADAAAQ